MLLVVGDTSPGQRPNPRTPERVVAAAAEAGISSLLLVSPTASKQGGGGIFGGFMSVLGRPSDDDDEIRFSNLEQQVRAHRMDCYARCSCRVKALDPMPLKLCSGRSPLPCFGVM